MAELQRPRKAKGFTYVQDTRPDNPQEGDTWYDTSSGKFYFYRGGWRHTKDLDTCWEKNPPSVTITPAEATIAEDGGSVALTVRVRNQDVGVCGTTTFTLTAHLTNTTDFDAPALSQTTVELGPYQEATVTLTVTDKPGRATAGGVTEVTVTATAPEHDASTSNVAVVRLTGTAFTGCTPVAPGLTADAASKSIDVDGGTVDYVLTLTNEDTGATCSPVFFELTLTEDNAEDFEASTLSDYGVTLDPGASTTVTLTVRDKPGAVVGSGVQNTTVKASASGHPEKTLTVTTTLTGGAEIGWNKVAPTLSITPSTQDIAADGGSVQYTITLTNNDSGPNAGATTFTLSVSDSNTTDFEPSTLSQTEVTLNPTESATVTLTVTDAAGAAADPQNVTTVTVTAPDHPTASDTVTTTLSGEAAAGCLRAAPSVSISPTSQTITTDGGTASYTVTITNNDSPACGATTFTLGVTDSNTTNFEPSVLGTTSVTLDPGASTTVALTVQDKAGDYPGTAVSNTTYVTVTSDVHGSVQSNTVTTTAEGDAVVMPGFGYMCGGYDGTYRLSVIDRFQYPFDGGTAVNVGFVPIEGSEGYAGMACSTHGFFHGSQDRTGVFISSIFRFQFPFNEGLAEQAGSSSYVVNDPGGVSSSTEGYVVAGMTDVDGTRYTISNIDRFDFPLDTGVVSACGYLSRTAYGVAGVSSTTEGYVAGDQSEVDRLSFPFDCSTTVLVGQLPDSRTQMGPVVYRDFGYLCTGSLSGTPSSVILRIDFPFSGTAVVAGNLGLERLGVGSCASTSYGYVGGGALGAWSTHTSTIERFPLPFDGTYTSGQQLSLSRNSLTGCSNVDPHLRW